MPLPVVASKQAFPSSCRLIIKDKKLDALSSRSRRWRSFALSSSTREEEEAESTSMYFLCSRMAGWLFWLVENAQNVPLNWVAVRGFIRASGRRKDSSSRRVVGTKRNDESHQGGQAGTA